MEENAESTIHLARLRKAEQPRTQPNPCPKIRWDGQTWLPSCSWNAHAPKVLLQRVHTWIDQATPEKVGEWEDARSGSKEPTSRSVLPLPYFVLCPLPKPNDIILVFDPDKPADNQGKDEKFLPLFVHDRHDRKAPEGRQRPTG